MFESSGLSVPEFDSLIRLIYEGIEEPVPWTRLLESLLRRLGANYVSLILRPPDPDLPWRVVFAGEAQPAIAASYETFFYAMDPFVNLPADRMTMVDEMINEADWLKSAIYQEFLKPLNIRYYMGADLGGSEDPICRLRVSRPLGSTPFGERERTICSLLLAHLKCAVGLRSRQDVVEAERSVYAGTLERLSIGAVILDKKGRVLKTNHAADEILADKNGVSLVHGTLQASYGSENRELHRLINQAIAGHRNSGPGVVSAMSITRSSGHGNLGILVRTAPLAEWSESATRPAAVVVIRDSESRVQASQSLMKRLYGLTPAESTLTLKLLDGLTVDEAAEELSISRNTARCQLRAIFAKTGVTRQTELLRMLLSGVIPLG
ncbi:helix-turn-helix transcriptional regulator [Aromatoleum anaerobium]|nr:helix-turn-helix transcriptional regulator [Aromatoleum anaerobium]MCK0508165.1 helix-turn-helix transcriptional regulator [Aromatoleum anaerobium]